MADEIGDLFATEHVGALDGYGALRVEAASAPKALVDDLTAMGAVRWLAEELRKQFEIACGAKVYGSLGNFDGVVAEAMPDHWRKADASAADVQVWVPDGRHPLGKWLADAAARLLPCASPEILAAVIKRHGIEGSREPVPQEIEIEDGWVLLVHKPKLPKNGLSGVSRDDSLLSLWRGPAVRA